MSLNEIMVEGTLSEDGSLALDRKPNLAAGRVTVILRQIGPIEPCHETWWEFMQRTRSELERRGAKFTNDAEVEPISPTTATS